MKEAFAKVDSLTELGWVNMAGYGVYSTFVKKMPRNSILKISAFFFEINFQQIRN